MKAPVQLRDPSAFFESLYGTKQDAAAWFASVAQALRPGMDFGWGVGLSLVHDVERPTLLNIQAVGDVSDTYERLQVEGVSLPEPAYQSIYRPAQPIVRASLPRTLQSRESGVLRAAMETIGADDALWIVGEPCAGMRFQIAAPLRSNMELSLRQREVIRQLRVHVEMALRIRLRGSDVSPCAVFGVEGRLQYLAPHLGRDDARVLSREVSASERAHLRVHHGAEDALLSWPSLVRGRWSMVVQSDGYQGRRYVIYENAPADGRRAFTELEQRAVELLAQGLSTKAVAHELGTSSSTASEATGRAMFKLGVCSKAELLALARALREDADAPPAESALSAAERAVLQFLRSGYSNNAIAAARRTSVHTVAKQVAAILRKTGALNRHQAASGHGS